MVENNGIINYQSTIKNSAQNIGDNSNQTISVNDSGFEKEFSSLLSDILKISDESKREQAKFFAEQLKEAVSKEDVDTGKKMIKFLNGILGTTSALITIGSAF